MAAAEPAVSLVADLRPYSIVVEDLDVSFRVFRERQLGLAAMAARGFRRREITRVEAVRGVNLAIREGDVVGVIGSNGSGKSTLMQAIGGLMPPTAGRVLVRTQPVLLGVGAVLKPQVTGRRNIVLGCLAMGLSAAEIEARMPSLEKFSGLGEALDRPMNTYSTGMRARLAFAVATVNRPDILLIDEALGVGDREFRRRSLNRIREMQAEAKTILMVSHNLAEIRSTCTRAIWMKDGAIEYDGDVDAVVDGYEADESGDDDD